MSSFFGELQVWFVANDIAEALGYVNAKDALKRHVDNEDRKGVAFHDPLGKNPQTMNTINESGMYSLILSSKKSRSQKIQTLGNLRSLASNPQNRLLPTKLPNS